MPLSGVRILGRWKEQESVDRLHGKGELCRVVPFKKGRSVSLSHCFFPLSKCRSGCHLSQQTSLGPPALYQDLVASAVGGFLHASLWC